jgi:DMSO/TMAO reductase YedYZ heme-binding membrane subunit
VLLGLAYYFRRAIGPARWQRLHRFTPVINVIASAHRLGAGSDGGTLPARLVVAGTAILIAILLTVRVAVAATPGPVPARASPRTARP